MLEKVSCQLNIYSLEVVVQTFPIPDFPLLMKLKQYNIYTRVGPVM